MLFWVDLLLEIYGVYHVIMCNSSSVFFVRYSCSSSFGWQCKCHAGVWTGCQVGHVSCLHIVIYILTVIFVWLWCISELDKV